MHKTPYGKDKESIFDKLIAFLRTQKVIKFIPERTIFCDLGCGYHGYFVKKISKRAKKAIGIDLEVDHSQRGKNIILIKANLNNYIPLKSNSQDIITALAVLEHLIKPKKALKEARRILKPGGKLILTTPTPKAKKLLEFLAFRLKLISKQEIKDHRYYYNRYRVRKLLIQAGFTSSKISYQSFQLGFNQLVIAKK